MTTKYLVLLLYLGILFAIGYFASKRIKGIKDYYVGGKKLGYWVVAFSARATGESGWLLLGVTGAGALVGVQVPQAEYSTQKQFKPDGPYKGWNVPAWIAFVLSILPVVPGFLVKVGVISAEFVGSFLVNLYSYTWFVTFGLSFLIYFLLKRMKGQ